MPVLTCAEMVAQCLDQRETGWRHFIREYLPFASALLERHFPQLTPRREALLREVLLRAADQHAQFFRDYSGHSEREFLLHLREHAMHVGEEEQHGPAAPEIPLEWDVFEKALQEFTPLERQVVWAFVLAPRTDDAAKVLRVDPKFVSATLAKAQELLRASSDHWNAEMLAENRESLARAGRALRTSACPAPKAFLRLLDGQITWRDRGELEQHLTGCWHCVDLLCRFREIAFLAVQVRPLSEVEAEPYLKLVGFETARPSFWARVLKVR